MDPSLRIGILIAGSGELGQMLACVQKAALGNYIIALKDRISTVDHCKTQFVQ